MNEQENLSFEKKENEEVSGIKIAEWEEKKVWRGKGEEKNR